MASCGVLLIMFRVPQVFRTNASYERWDGARKMWGLVLNRSRDIVRQVRCAAVHVRLEASFCRPGWLGCGLASIYGGAC